MIEEKIILNEITTQLKDKGTQEKYINLLNVRIDENRRISNSLLKIMIFSAIAFPLILETKISEISLGPFKLLDNSIAIGIIPTLFAFTYYRYMSVLSDLREQKKAYRHLTTVLFDIKYDSFLNNNLSPYSLVDSIGKFHFNKESKATLILTFLFWIPVLLTIIFMPIIFVLYAAYKTYITFGLDSYIDWGMVLTPFVIIIISFIMVYEAVNKSPTNMDTIT